MSRRACWVGLLALVAGVAASFTARAEEPAYCARVKARAGGEAALLMSPTAVVQGIRFPSSGQIDSGPTLGKGYQLRTGLAFSPLDFYKGTRVMKASDADCERHVAAQALEGLLTHGYDRAKLRALRAQAGFLREHAAEWRVLSSKAEERLRAQVITLSELDEFRRRIAELERKLVSAEGDVERLGVREHEEAPFPPVEASVAHYREADSALERENAHLRSLDAWQLRVAGGVIPESPVDWYGMAEISFNFGGFERNRQSSRAEAARRREVEQSSYELGAHAREFEGLLRAERAEVDKSRALVDEELSFMARARHALDASSAQNIVHARDILAVEHLALEAEGVFLREYGAALAAMSNERKPR